MNPKFKIMLPLFLFALVLACSKDTPEPEVSVPPISGLDFAISTNEENPLQVGVTPSATNATSYKIYFDFVGDATTFQTSDGTIVTHTYPEASATYTIKVVASNLDGSDDVELTKQHIVTVVPDTVLIDFESIGPPYFSGSEIEGYIEVVTSGVGDNSTAVGKIVNDGALYTTANIVNMNYIDLTGGVKTITLDFFVAKIYIIKLTRVRPQLKMTQPSVRSLNANYLWFFIQGPTQLSLPFENSENYLAND